MTSTAAHLSISLDGFVAGPGQSVEHPLGRGGLEVHRWYLTPEEVGHEVDARWSARLQRQRGAHVMGRTMFGPVRGPWSTHEGRWRGWWGDEPPYHAPVFVLTHHAHDPIETQGTTFRLDRTTEVVHVVPHQAV